MKDIEDYFLIILAILIFATYLIFEIILLNRVPLKYHDKTGRILLVTYTGLFLGKAISALLLLIGVFDNRNNTAMKMVNAIATQLLWLSLCYFAIEIRSLKIIIDSGSPEEYKRRMLLHKKQVKFIMVTQTLVSIISTTNNFNRFIDSIAYKELHWLSALNIGIRTVKQLCDIFIVGLFIHTFHYLIEQKRKRHILT